MAEKASYTKLGVFVVVTTALLMGGLALLGAGAFLKKTIVVETYFPESVQGLDKGAAVRMRGVAIGKVSEIDLVIGRPAEGEKPAVSGYVRVEMVLDAARFADRNIANDISVGIEHGLRARVASASLMGGGYLEIIYGRPDAPFFKPPVQSRKLFVPSTPSVMTEIFTAAERLANQLEAAEIDKVAKRMSSLMQHLDEKVQEVDIKRIQNDAVALLDEVRSTNARVKALLENPNIDKTLDNVSRAAADFPALTDRTKAVATKIDDILNEKATTEMLAHANDASAAASAALADLRRLARRLDALLAEQSPDLEATVGALRQTLENVEYLSGDARQNPARVIFGEPPPHYGTQRGQGEQK